MSEQRPIVLELTREELERLLDWASWKDDASPGYAQWDAGDRELRDRLRRLLLRPELN